MTHIENQRIQMIEALMSPNELKSQQQSSTAQKNVAQFRNEIENIIHLKDPRLLIVVGPCSIHDPVAAVDYAKRLQSIQNKLDDALCLNMRCYFEKPRTTVGWKGLINDPYLDNTCDINQGLKTARSLLIEINELGLGVATEFLDTLTPQYIADLVSWGAIGARTSESQNHRNLVSGLSMPVGIKNSTTGSIQVAVDGVVAAQHAHSFLGITNDGQGAIVQTSGNPDSHIILRGSTALGPNYDAKSIAQAQHLLQQKSLSPIVMVDCSHANSEKDYRKQHRVASDICQQIANGQDHIVGIMIESFIEAGNQSLNSPSLDYGKSITDSCISWEETEVILNELAQTIRVHRHTNSKKSIQS